MYEKPGTSCTYPNACKGFKKKSVLSWLFCIYVLEHTKGIAELCRKRKEKEKRPGGTPTDRLEPTSLLRLC
jgi:hypothetical protein